MDLKLRCSGSGCDCLNFVAAASKDSLRVCEGCSHSWMTHLLEKLMTSRDDALSVFDVCSLALYGTHALPIRLKIVIERLLSTLQPEEVDKILRSFGWTPQDLGRGYMIQDPRGGLLTKWTMPPRDEEVLILQQFFRFPVTSALSFALLRDDFPLISPQQPGSIRPPFPTIFHPSLGLLPQGQGGQGQGQGQGGQPLTSNHNGNSSSGSSSASLLSPKSPNNVNNNNNNLSGHPGPIFPTHLGLAALANFPTNFPQTATPIPNQQNNGNGNGNPNGKVSDRCFPISGEKQARGRSGSRRSTNSSVLNLSTQSESEDEDYKGKEEKKEVGGQAVDLSQGQGSNGHAKSHKTHHNHNHNGRGGDLERDRERLINSLNALIPKGGGESGENNHKEISNQSPLFKGGSHPLQMSNEFLNNLNNIQKSVDLMAMVAGQGQQGHGQSHGHGGGQQGSPQGRAKSLPVSKGRDPRGWNPIPLGAQMVNPASGMTPQGKRRVQCSVCLKTFCDKGALKIHFSAVHLREMHKCTVAGCNMMFSSRRSRNRHSANPNPKLHSPHLRRKISPHDGRSSQPLINLNNPMLFPRFPPFMPGGMGLPQNGGMGGMPMKEEARSSDDEGEGMKGMELKLESDMLDCSNSEASFSSEPNDNENDNEEGIELDQSRSSVSTPGVKSKGRDGARKRKLTNPVRLSANVADSNDSIDNDNDEFCCYDDGTLVPSSHEDENDDLEGDKSAEGSENGGPFTPPEEKQRKLNTEPEKRRNSAPSSDNNHNQMKEETETNHLGKLESLPIFAAATQPGNSDSSGDEDEAGSPNSIGDIPIDPENPRRCLECGKEFQNHFGVKTHYLNVHFKSMHKCTVDGCNASFPSKRARDRHASNSNLHRKLLSTSDRKNESESNNESGESGGESLRKISKEGKSSSPQGSSIHPIFNPFFFPNGAIAPTGLPSQAMSPPLANPPPWNPFIHFNFFPNIFGSPIPNGESNQNQKSSPSVVDCGFCGKSFMEGPNFFHHLESSHPNDLYRCKCSSVFDSKGKLDSHSKSCVE